MNYSVFVVLLFILLFPGNVDAQISKQPLSGKVEMYKGRPTIFINDVPTYPMIYALTDLPGGRLTYEEMPQHNIEQFCKAGVKIFYFCLFFDQIWKQDGTFDISIVQKQIRGVLDVCPEASIFIRLHMHSPKWWLEQHPEEAVQYADGKAMPDVNGRFMRSQHDDPVRPFRYSLASELWKKTITEKTILLCQKLSSVPEGNAVTGIQIAGGVYGEWHYWGGESDISKAMTDHFRSWLKEKYKSNGALQKAWNKKGISFESAMVPGLKERKTSIAGVFRDPLFERNVIDYYECQHQLVSGRIIDFCKTVKENWPRKIITGTFYGYFFSLYGRETSIGHLEMQRVLKSPYVDYLSGPQAYYPEVQNPGDPARPRGLLLSCMLNGKLWLDEYDTQPDISKITNPGLDTTLPVYLKTVQNAEGLVRRNILSSATKGMGLWFFDFGVAGGKQQQELKDNGSNGWWDFPPILADIKNLKEILEKNRTKEYQSDADVLMVYDTKVFYQLATEKKYTHITRVADDWTYLAAWKSGVGLEAIHLDDLPKADLKKYKTIIFGNTYLLNADQKKFIKENIYGNGRHIVWTYAPGYSDGSKLDMKNMADLTGISFEKIKFDKAPKITITELTAEKFTYGVTDSVVNPLFAVNDAKVKVWGQYEGTDKAAIVQKEMKDYTVWYMGLPSYNLNLVKSILQKTGAHVYNNSGDIFYVGDNMLGIHTKEGGARTVKLKNGKEINLNLPAGSSTCILNKETGEYILKP